MDVQRAIAIAKDYVAAIYKDEQIGTPELEEVENVRSDRQWSVTLSFSRPITGPKTPAQTVMEGLGAGISVKRAYKVITIAADGSVISMKDRLLLRAAE